MNSAMTAATARRVMLQLRQDPRTVVLMILVPSLLMVLLRYVFDSAAFFSGLAPALLGFFPFLMMFLVTSVTMLRERTSGTLERLMTTPTPKLALLLGYAAAFAVLAVAEVVVAVAVSVWLGMDVAGAIWWLLLVAVLDALLGTALGLLASAFAHTEFQALQFMPVIVLPQLLLCGLFRPRAQMADVLRWASDVMPLSYAVSALQRVQRDTDVGGGFTRDTVVVAACVMAALALGAATLRRHTR
jgi:ABC-2 type transport system permease protein